MALLRRIINLNKRLNKLYSTSGRTCTEIKIPVDWGFVSGKWWGPQKKRPVLVLHGWQDNCGSFDTLIPLLPENVEFLTIDFPGHGYSSPIPNGLYYYNMDGVILIRRLQKYFGWPQVPLMGHSLGAMTSFIYSATYPEDVEFLIAFDGFKPFEMPGMVKRRAQAIDSFLKYNSLNQLEPPSYPLDVLVNMWHEGSRKSVALDKCKYLLKRNTAPSTVDPDKYYLTRDSRLKTCALYNIPQEEAVESGRRLTMPVLAIKASDMPYVGKKEDFMEVFDVVKDTSSDFRFHIIEGSHHVHLNHPERVQGIVTEFLNKHYIENKIENNNLKINNLS